MNSKSVFLVLILCSIFVFPVEADTHGLKWGVSVGSRADYTISMEADGTTVLEEEFYVIVSDLENLADQSWDTEILSLEIQYFWKNGTEFDPSFHGMLISNLLPSWILPVGNWTLITEVFTRIRTEGVNDTPEFWGFSWESSHALGHLNRGDVEYSKTDGMLNVLSYEVMMVVFQRDTDAFYQEISRRPHPNLSIVLHMSSLIGSLAVVLVLLRRELLIRRN
ncbi:MAG: hypothetical protein JSW61_15195 [Candidatus Thorarchaeota archaeon]|nr:MAG: hypothetical protein JSW61_15195 [Candidatus Thorarchaeota archaeon]